MNLRSEQNSSDSLLEALVEKNTQTLTEMELKPYAPTVYAMLELLKDASTFQPTLYQKLKALATWEEVQELASQLGDQLEEGQAQGTKKVLSALTQNNRQALSQIREELEKEQASRESFQQQAGKLQEEFTSRLSKEFSAWQGKLEEFQQETERRWRSLRRRNTLGLVLSWALACGALWMLLR